VKLLTGCLAISLIFIGCGTRQSNIANDNSAITSQTRMVEATPPASPSTSATSAPVTNDGERPVEFTYLGITPDKESISFEIKVNTSKPVSQVDIGIKYMDDGSSKVLEETTYAWQNIVKSVRKPIEKGKTYEAEGYLPQGATKAECILKRVIFEDGSRWDAD
jgi:hypothetical protein